jgi:ATP citrate (pro-S)-lyase
MAAKSIHEADGKAILSYHLTRSPPIAPSPLPAPKHNAPPKLASITFPADASPAAILDGAEQMYPWLLEPGARFVAKPDQLIKRRGKAGLLALNKEWSAARAWIEERAGKEIQVESVKGYLRTFLVEPFCPHKPEEEYYINIHSVREVSCRLFPPSCLRFRVASEYVVPHEVHWSGKSLVIYSRSGERRLRFN